MRVPSSITNHRANPVNALNQKIIPKLYKYVGKHPNPPLIPGHMDHPNIPIYLTMCCNTIPKTKSEKIKESQMSMIQ